MGNHFSFGKKEDPSKKAKIRRIYIGDAPELRDDEEAPVGKKGRLERTSQQSFSDKDFSPSESEPPVPVRRQSIVGGEVVQRVRNVFPNNEVRSSRYTFWTFIPFNLVEQFRRVVNFYFLVVATIQLLTDSPVHPVTAIAPLAFVIFVTMLKQGYEDWLRHKADNLFNHRPVKVIRDGIIEIIKSKDVKVGDIIKLDSEEQVPTDIVLLGSSDEFQRCLLNTANLDGETSLKMRYVPAGLPHFRDESDFMTLSLIVECEEPCQDLYRFNGNMLVPPSLQLHTESSLGTIFEHIQLPDASDVEGGEFPTMPIMNGVNPIKESDEVIGNAPNGIHTDTSGRRHSTNAEHFGDQSKRTRNSFAGPSHATMGTSMGPPRTGKRMKVGFTDFNMIFLGMENVILRGTKVKNTDFVYGVVIYTGGDTRLAKNSAMTAPKFSTVEKTVNKYLYVFICILAVLVTAASTVSLTGGGIFGVGGSPWYLESGEAGRGFKHTFGVIASFIILFNYIIPISLYVTMEMQKFVGSKFFVWDKDMATEYGEPPLCNTSDLNEELGQIEYLFSDKTGTLTENVMKTKIFSINSKIYDVTGGKLFLRNVEDQSKKDLAAVKDDPDLVEFCSTLALCHSIQIMPKRRPSVEAGTTSGGGTLDMFLKMTKNKISSKVKNANSLFTIGGPQSTVDIGMGGQWEFQGSSPDEKALVETCAQLGVCYDGEKEEMLSVNVCGKEEKYKRHMMLEFDADRKCMSVIVENEAGEIFILTKGAENAVLSRCDTGPTKDVMKHVLTFAMMGLRTLVIARRQLNRQELDDYIIRLKAARRLVEHRDETMKQIYRDIESHLHVIGATGVEDLLQEGVTETLHALGAAGIRVWMLTGDKVETAIAVAYSCGLMGAFSENKMLVNLKEKEEVIHRLVELDTEMCPDDNHVLIVDGESIEIALEEKECHNLFRDVAMKAFRVVCCRMTPLQKSRVVKMVKETKRHPITAAVGDGANDVAMIQEAHIGIGIIGKEGRQAARCADFALAKFSFLKKAILVHGHWYYVRLANLANYFFYKNIIFVLPQVFYCFSSAFSTQALFDSIFLMMYNIFYTACPILIYGLMEQPHSAQELMDCPHLYKDIRRNRLMTISVFLRWLSFALWHGFVCYFYVYFAWWSFYPVDDLSSFGTVVFCAIIAVTNMKIAIETRFISFWYIGSQVYSYVTFLLFTGLYSEIDLTAFYIDPKQFQNVFFRVMGLPVFWVLMVLITGTAIIPDILWKGVEGSWNSVERFFQSIPRESTYKIPRNSNFANVEPLNFFQASAKVETQALGVSSSHVMTSDSEIPTHTPPRIISPTVIV